MLLYLYIREFYYIIDKGNADAIQVRFQKDKKAGGRIYMYTKLNKNEHRDFLQSKYEYYKSFNTCAMICACLLSVVYFIRDCMALGRFADETLPSRICILIPMTIFLIIDYKCINYRVGVLFSQLLVHMVTWCGIWAMYRLGDPGHAGEYFIMIQLAFLAISFASPFAYTTVSHCLLIFDILISHLFNHYEHLNIMLMLAFSFILIISVCNLIMCNESYENYRNKKRMEASLVIDPLTQVYNRNIMSTISKDGALTFVRSNFISFLMVDIDWFKNVNDTYGHDKGDIVLKSVTTVIQNCTRGGDYTIRWGGEEFVVIMPECPINEAVIVAERIRSHIMEYDNTICPITVSIGVADYDLENYDNAISNADKALYVAKQTGRNKVVCYTKGSTTEILTSTKQF